MKTGNAICGERQCAATEGAGWFLPPPPVPSRARFAFALRFGSARRQSSPNKGAGRM